MLIFWQNKHIHNECLIIDSDHIWGWTVQKGLLCNRRCFMSGIDCNFRQVNNNCYITITKTLLYQMRVLDPEIKERKMTVYLDLNQNYSCIPPIHTIGPRFNVTPFTGSLKFF